MAVERSDKLKWQVYEPSIAEAPYLVYYMKQSSDNYTSSGYNFNIKTPALGAFLDPEAYLSFKINIKAKNANDLDLLFRGSKSPLLDPKDSLLIKNDGVKINPASNYLPYTGDTTGIKKFAFRQGNIFQRATQQIVLTINGFTLNAEPWKWIDPLNRLMVSNEQSKHVFSGSGGKFDSGNHGIRCNQNNFAYNVFWDKQYTGGTSAALLPADPGISNFKAMQNIGKGTNVQTTDNLSFSAQTITDGFNILAGTVALTSTTVSGVGGLDLTHPDGGIIAGIGSTYLYKWPNHPHFYNPGFTERVHNMIKKCRGDVLESVVTGVNNLYNASTNSVAVTGPPVLPPSGYFVSDNNVSFSFMVYEPIPLPPFKMYHNDGVGGIIPHVRDMTLRGTFTANLLANLFMANYDIDGGYASTTVADNMGCFAIDFSTLSVTDCQVYMKWYLPPPSLTIPREISIPYRKYDMYISSTACSNISQPATNATMTSEGTGSFNFSQYNISLDAVPDLLLIYLRYKNDIVKTSYPCDMHCEIVQLTLQLENNGGKLNQMNSYQMYQNWLKYIKFDDPIDVDFDEFRKYCCVAALKPDDYGIIRGPGWDNVVVLGVQGQARFWGCNPSINLVGAESWYNCIVTKQEMELVVVSIYDRWHLTLSADGTARANLTRIRDLGNPLPPSGMAPVP